MAGMCQDVKYTIPTIAFNVEVASTHTANTALGFVSWYVGGADKIRPLWRHYYNMTNGLIFVVDSTGDYGSFDTVRLDESRKELHLMLREEELANHPVLVLANKQDLGSAKSAEQVEQLLGLRDTVDWSSRGLNAFLMGTHPVKGACCQLNRLRESHLLEYIWEFVEPLTYQTPAAVLNGRACHVQPCCITTGEGVLEGIEWIKRAAPACTDSVWEKWEEFSLACTNSAWNAQIWGNQSIIDLGSL